MRSNRLPKINFLYADAWDPPIISPTPPYLLHSLPQSHTIDPAACFDLLAGAPRLLWSPARPACRPASSASTPRLKRLHAPTEELSGEQAT
jgi:hypothetical protein